MAWILTRTGAEVDLELFDMNSISALDIAAALSKINRFHGHTSRPYTVAEHSLHVVTVLEREMQITDPGALFAGLMHDGHEAYTNDLATPLKVLLGETWRKVEDRAMFAVARRFGYWQHYLRHAAAIKVADLTMLAVERRDLMPPGGTAWPALAGVDALPFYHLHEFAALDHDDWRDAFVERFAELHQAARAS